MQYCLSLNSKFLSILPHQRNFLMNVLDFGNSITPIQNKNIKTILHARKSLLFNKNAACVKTDNPDFDVTMGSFDGTGACQLVGLYLL